MTTTCSTQAHDGNGDGDGGKRYEPNAGQCDHCGQYKTWDFRIPNPKTGKMLPGHIDQDGHKLGNGNCPFWENIFKKNEQRRQQKQQHQQQQPRSPRTSYQHPSPPPRHQPEPVHPPRQNPVPPVFESASDTRFEVDRAGDVVTIHNGVVSIELSGDAALALTRDIVAKFTSR